MPGASIFRGGGTVAIGLGVWSLGNYAFFLIAGRVLGPSDYGLVAALLAGIVVISVPASGLQFAAARLVAAPPGGEPGLAEGIYRRAVRLCVFITPAAALAACVAAIAVRVTVGGFRAGPLVLATLLAMPLGFMFLAFGRLQGERRFTAFALCFGLWGAFRPIVLLPLATLGLGVYAALGATGAAVAVAVFAAFWFTREKRPAREPTVSEWRAFTVPIVPVVAGLSALGVLTNIDVIVAKIVLPAADAGQFAAAATVAKAVFLVPQAVSLVLLPRVAARTAAAEDTGILIGLGVGATLAAGGVASLGLWLIAEPLLRMTYGADFVGSAALLGAYAAASTIVGALMVAINHHVARGADRFVWGGVGVAALQILLFVAFHGSQVAIVAVNAIAGSVGLILHECMFFRTSEAIVPGLLRAVRHRDES